MLSGCGGPDLPPGTVGFVEGFLGGVVADEPRAALTGREVLASGGSAADAAVAMYFTMAVTHTATAGLGGGGVCLAFSNVSKKAEFIDFTATAPATTPASADRPSAVPGNPRGFFALHSRYGRLRWGQLLAPAEQLARFGAPVSRVMAVDLAAYAQPLLADPEMRRIFGKDGGRRIAREGEPVEQLELAAVIGLLRAKGAGPFYVGPFARQLSEATNGAGGSLSVQDLQDYRPRWGDTVKVPLGFNVAHFAAPPAAGSVSAAQMFRMLDDAGYASADEGARAHLLAETGLRAYADRMVWLQSDLSSSVAANALTSDRRIDDLMRSYNPARHTQASAYNPAPRRQPENPSASVFVAVDADANAVACAVTMNSAFGTGRIAQGTGMVLASVPDRGGRGPSALSPMLVVNQNGGDFFLAAAAAGGSAAPSALASVAARVLLADEDLGTALSAPRVHHGGAPDVTYHEPGLSASALQHLTGAGHSLGATATIGRINVISCPDGIINLKDTCTMAADPRGGGLAAGSIPQVR